MKKDAFRPNSPIDDPEQFVGRVAALRTFASAMAQVKAGQPRHLAITGERGVGKSSFLNQAIRIAEGDSRLILKHRIEQQQPFRFKVIRVDATYRYDVPDLCQAFEQRIQSTLDRLKNQALSALKLELGPLKIDFSHFKDKPVGVEDSFVGLIMRTHDEWKKSEDLSGLILAVDEVDRIDSKKVGLGTFFKLVTERLSREGYPAVVFAICGQVGAIQGLKSEHESVGRVFIEIPIGVLDENEVRAILEDGFAKAQCRFDNSVPALVRRLSRGLGSRVHLIGSHCLQVDTDDCIDADDVEAAKDLLITETLRSELVAALRFAGSGKYKRILEVIANHPKDIVPLQDIANDTGWAQNEFSANMGTLVQRNTLDRPEDGRYRFTDPLLKAYIQKFGVGLAQDGNGA